MSSRIIQLSNRRSLAIIYEGMSFFIMELDGHLQGPNAGGSKPSDREIEIAGIYAARKRSEVASAGRSRNGTENQKYEG